MMPHIAPIILLCIKSISNFLGENIAGQAITLNNQDQSTPLSYRFTGRLTVA
jgi:hypothetical protein